MKYRNVSNAVFNQPWAIYEPTMGQIVQVLRYRMAGGKYSVEEIEERVGERSHPEPQMFDAETLEPWVAVGGNGRRASLIGVLPVYGVLAQRMNVLMEMSGGTSTEMLGAQLDAMVRNPDVRAIVLDVDSPGGSVFGIEELGETIFRARKQKRIVAVANSQAFSAAYWLASAADELWVTPGGMAGSIGVIAVHWDESRALDAEGLTPTIISYGKFKAEGNELEPLGDEARAEVQRIVDQYGATFDRAVARNRNVTTNRVSRDFGQGRIFRAAEAVERGLANKVGTLADAIASLTPKQRASTGAASSAYGVTVNGEVVVLQDHGLPFDEEPEAPPEDDRRKAVRARTA